METLSTHSSENEKFNKLYRNNSSVSICTISLSKINRHHRTYSFNKKTLKKLNIEIDNKYKKFFSETEKKHYRKDIYGNIIKKGGKHKISFKDSFKGKYLVEMTLIDVKQNSLKGKNYKNLTIFREARDKEELFCSGVCTIF